MLYRKFKDLALSLSGFATLGVLWQVAHSQALVNPVLLPSVPGVAQRLFYLVSSGDVLADAGFTLIQTAGAFGLASVVGVLAGLAVGTFPLLRKAAVPLIDFFRSVPITTLYPVFVLTLGIGALSKFAMAFVASVWIVALNAAYGVQQADPIRSEMARLYGASPVQIFLHVRFFEALPQSVVGLRIALSYCLVVEILAEMFMGSQLGLGQRITEAYTTYIIEELYALIILVGLIGYAANRLFLVVESRVVHWSRP